MSRRGVLTWAAGLCLLLAACSASWAQGSAPAAARNPQYQALFKRMFDDPTNVEATFRFAEMAIKLGDYEAAVGALERILFFNPNLPRVRLQLGVLYFKLGSYPMARSYFEQARGTPGAPVDVRTQADQFLAEMDRRLSPHRWSLFAHTGLRYQSNASAGPDGILIKSLGQDAVLNSQFSKKPDWNWFGLVGANYSYDLQRGNEDALEASFTGYYSKQFSISRVDLGLVEVTAGPRLSLPFLPPELGASLKVYVIGTATTLASSPYFAGPGIGVSTRFNVANFARVEPFVELRQRNFQSSGTYPTAGQQSGTLSIVGVQGSGSLFAKVPWFGRTAFDTNRASDGAFAFNSYDRWSAIVGFPIPYTLTINNRPYYLVITPTIGGSRTAYAMPNPMVHPTITRLDHEWNVGLLLDAQIYMNYGARAHLFYSQTKSSLPNFETKNFSFSVGPTVRF